MLFRTLVCSPDSGLYQVVCTALISFRFPRLLLPFFFFNKAHSLKCFFMLYGFKKIWINFLSNWFFNFSFIYIKLNVVGLQADIFCRIIINNFYLIISGVILFSAYFPLIYNPSALQWRSRRDSNPRNGCPFTRLAGECLQPLGHDSTY